MAIPLVVGAIVSGLGGVLSLARNPIIAWLLALGVLFIDSGASFLFSFPGAIGSAFSWLVSGLAGFPVVITSFQLMVLIAFVGVISMAVFLRK